MLEGMLRKTLRHQRGSDESFRHSSRQRAGSFRRKTDLSTLRKPGEVIDKTVHCRYELKYRISESKASAIERFVKPYLHLDHYCKLQPSGTYPVVTLYLDSQNLRLCRQTLEGNKNRFKLRIRSYTDDLEYPRFFEIKRRMNAIIIKTRSRVKHQNMAALLSGLSVPVQDYSEDEDTLKQFLLYTKSINAGPVVRVRYVRRAFEDDSENRVRVTFDRELACNVGSALDVGLKGWGWQRHSLNGVILEIKFTARFPAWLSQMVRCLNLQQQSISKYVTSLKQSCLVHVGMPLK